MKNEQKTSYSDVSLAGDVLSRNDALSILQSDSIPLLSLITDAYRVRENYWGNEVMVHIINNAQNGFCPEDCHYCAQAKSSKANIEEYPLKSDDEFLNEAKSAYEKGAHRYCMVFAGRGPSPTRVKRLADLIRKIKAKYPLEICVSAGLVDDEKAQVLKAAGLDRLNHNLNTSQKHYPNICATHTYEDRIQTLEAARKNKLDVCSGIIVGMGETADDIIDVALSLRDKQVKSIPVNFFIPIEGTQLKPEQQLTPQYCLRVLCLFRFLNPTAEIRVAAGRELHFRDLEVFSLYPANSLFVDGYLNTIGKNTLKTFQMIKDAGFTIKSDYSVDEVLEKTPSNISNCNKTNSASDILIKGLKELRPTLNT